MEADPSCSPHSLRFAALGRAVPARVHEGLAWMTLAICLLALWREYIVLGENNRLIDEAALRRGAEAKHPQLKDLPGPAN